MKWVSANGTALRRGRSDRWISVSGVLWPAPESPVTNSISPAPTSKLTSDSATWPPGYCLLTLSKRRTLMGPGFGSRDGGLRKAKASSPDPPSRPGTSRPRPSVLRVRRPRPQLLQAAADARAQRGLLVLRRGGRGLRLLVRAPGRLGPARSKEG